MKQRAVLGIDTSNYKTSAALVREDGKILCDRRRFLDVPENERGLRQQNALFQHVTHLPELIEQVFSDAAPARSTQADSAAGSGTKPEAAQTKAADGKTDRESDGIELIGVAVSTRPRPVEGSYMPVFLAGEGTGRSIAAAQGVPLIRVSHQEGHIRAAAESSGMAELPERLISFHFSGGTTEAVLIDQGKKGEGDPLWYEKVGGTRDLAAGQVLDRIGVQLGFPFPCGQELDRIAVETEAKGFSADELPDLSAVPCRDGYVNLSGLETDCSRRVEEILGGKTLSESIDQESELDADEKSGGLESEQRDEAAKLVLVLMKRITRAAARMTCDLGEKYGIRDFLLAGGVASSVFMREHFHEELALAAEKKEKSARKHKGHARLKARDYRIYFGSPALSSDNAVGTALLGLDQLKSGGAESDGAADQLTL